MQNDIKELLAVHEEFEDMVLQKKYYHDGETNWVDVVDRLKRTFDIDSSTYDFIKEKYFIPGGSILANAGSDQDLSMSNCYYIPIKEDSLSEIFDCNKNLAEISKRRGGCGFSLDNLRPKGCKVNNSAKTSSGAVSFLPLFNSTGLVVGQGGRRMAMIALLDIRHPDVLDFIWCKSKPEKVFISDSFTTSTPDLSMMNISLKITDDFMEAVEKDKDWDFIYPEINEYYFKHWNDGDFDSYKGEMKVYKTMPAREVFNQIMESSFMTGDPGVMFIDNHNRNCYHDKLKKRGTNPCGEIGTANYENCLLGHLNLPKFVKNPYSPNSAEFDVSLFKDAVATGVEFLNVVSQKNKHPLQSQNIMDAYSRQIGLGITGFADLCAMLCLDYKPSKDLEYIMRIKAITEIRTSMQLVKEGKFKKAEIFNEEGVIERFMDTSYITNLQYNPVNTDDFLTKQDLTDIKKHGLANSSFSTVAPTGSVSIIADNCSSGIEPVFKLEYVRKNRIDNIDRRFIHKPILKCYRDRVLPINFKDFFKYKEASEINFRDRIDIQAMVQRCTTNSISSTLNLPSNTSIADLKEICFLAWKKGLKGYTTFIEGNKSGVLLAAPEKKVLDKQEKIEYKRELLDVETSERHRVAWKKARLYINVSLDEDGNPIEIFSDLPKSAGVDGKSGVFNPMVYLERLSNWHFITRLISNALRYGIPLKELVEQAEKSSFSMVDAPGIISRILKKYLTEYEESFSICPECNENSVVRESGCIQCTECGYSKCG